MSRGKRAGAHGRRAGGETLYVDAANASALLDDRPLALSPRAFAVLACLAARAGELLTKDDLNRQVWRGAAVSDGALVTAIRELRRALGDDAHAPRHIETVQRRGYRYIGTLASALRPAARAAVAERAARGTTIGRADEIARLEAALDEALAGRRRVVFVGGEPGIGKTTLVNTFLEGIVDGPHDDGAAATRVAPLVARGQCIEGYGASEAYLPWLEALDRLCRGAGGARVITILEREAPGWLAQLPGVLAGARSEAVRRRALGSSRGRMQRELAQALEHLAETRPLVLILEDLHWCDPSTVRALDAIARRAEPARLLIVATYRPAELHRSEHPFGAIKNELLVHQLCEEITPRAWGAQEIAAYLAIRRGAPGVDDASDETIPLLELLQQRSGGNPLFVGALVDDLEGTGALLREDHRWTLAAAPDDLPQRVPLGVRPLLQQQGARLPEDERRLLEAASVAGREFSAAAVAAALGEDIEAVERRCAGLAARGEFLCRSGIAPWPDGTLAARYAFVHALHQQAWFEQVSPAALQRYNLAIGLRKELGYGTRSGEIAAELAGHFVDARDLPRAVRYLHLAGTNAARRSAHQEAERLLALGLELGRALPPGTASERQMLALQTTLGPVLMAAKGYAAPEVERTYSHARRLSQRVGDTTQTFLTLYGLWTYYVVRPRHRAAHAIARRLLRLADNEDNAGWRIEAHWAHGCSSFLLGDPRTGHGHFMCSARHYRQANSHSLAFDFGHDPGVSTLSFGAIASWQLGLLDEAMRNTDEARNIAAELGHPFSLVYALTFSAWIRLLEGDFPEARRLAALGHAQSATYDIPMFRAMCAIFGGAAAIAGGSGDADTLAGIAQAIDDYRGSGGDCICPHFLGLYAEACGTLGETTRGLDAVAEALALVERNDERWCEAELHRVRGVLTWLSMESRGACRDLAAVAHDFDEALAVARRQGGLTAELRCCLVYAPLIAAAGEPHRAHALLADVVGRFNEGFACADLRRADVLLRDLDGAASDRRR